MEHRFHTTKQLPARSDPNEYRGNEKLDAVAKGAISQGAELVPCDVHLRFSANNPYVVTVSTSAPDTDSGKWRLSRDLLSAGLTGAAGIGAVAVKPEAFDGLDLQVRIRVRELDGEAPLDGGVWDRRGEFGLDAPSGHLGQNLIAVGGDEAIDLPWSGRWRARA
ncbi:SsgA family sporulation/cell division regulator [Streptomyces luteolus]|uniref:SsgA family sporulation/cell division regulator n=1 Tax=Streptomyces luteolus TaxID=3043615 RepID=A0ABT6T928_9ACTN|nr:SsgA family sporulation/cell division regulator [Streptomyces sp. B-S-A12]MDI3424111.1 SsgA family sporulation/cell division regulator [Streptomyces sp. B-S-A12]